jgi:zinc/manganese transport system substrate-binding protein
MRLDHPRLFQHRQRPIDRGDRDLPTQLLMELGGGPGPVDPFECRHHVAAPGRVAHSGLGELLLDPSILDWHCHVGVSRLSDNDSHYRRYVERRKVRPFARVSITALGLTLALAACADSPNAGDDGLLVVATTSILGDIVGGVVGDDGDVEVLIPIGVDAHDFSPSSQQASLLAGADLVVANGLGLEAGLEDVLASVANDGVRVLELAPAVEPIEFRDGGGLDPHFWMDPIRVGDAAVVLADALDDHHPGSWQAGADSYAAALESTDREVEERLSVVPQDRREMVTNHEAFGYFADRYGFEIVGVVIPGGSTLAEPSSAELADLVDVMEQSGTNAIFAETTEPTTLAEAVAAEVGNDVEVVELYSESLGGPGSGAETLQEMLVTNAGRISDALG